MVAQTSWTGPDMARGECHGWAGVLCATPPYEDVCRARGAHCDGATLPKDDDVNEEDSIGGGMLSRYQVATRR